jgi:hypothetical protein
MVVTQIGYICDINRRLLGQPSRKTSQKAQLGAENLSGPRFVFASPASLEDHDGT